MAQRTITNKDRDVLLALALGEDGWQERIESRFVHKVTGEAIGQFDARVHGSIFDWQTERRRVIETDWDTR
jgi:hypothetical protein